ncbi:MAG: respiratory nitrate reductase subunit gamma, partial [Proteobacteria bacterium]|nr:respiratory nitrate reductase subunit gamma [Pseudomonadota bacterium]
KNDAFVISWLMVTLLLGLATLPFSIGHANKGDPAVMMALADWVKSILLLNPQPELLENVDPIFRAHIFFGLTVFLIFPFTRLVHILTAPFSYLGRAYQIVRTKRA